jgi:type IV fimbrial biogenesis protein FimT
MLSQRTHRQGFSLVELVVAMAIVAFVMALAIPTFGTWSQNVQIRTVAESIQNGLQLARTEAMRRNTEVRFQLTSTIDNTCALSTTQPNWVVNIGNATATGTHDPTTLCGSTLLGPTVQWNSGTTPYLVQTYSANAVAPNVVASISSAANSLIVFNSLGQVTWPTIAAASTCVSSAGTASSGNVACIDLTNPTGGACLAASGPMTCMRIEVTIPGGQIRMCNPNVTAGMPQGCLP